MVGCWLMLVGRDGSGKWAVSGVGGLVGKPVEVWELTGVGGGG